MSYKVYKQEIINEGSDNYSVMIGDGSSDSFEIKKFKSPKEAIEAWIAGQKAEPMNANISAKSDSLKVEFYDWIFDNLEWYAKAVNKQKAYKTNYLYTQVQAVLKDKTDKDALHPFTAG